MKLRDLFVQIGFQWDPTGVKNAAAGVNMFSRTLDNVNFLGFIGKIASVRYALNSVKWALDSFINVFTTFLEAGGQKERVEIAFEVLTGSATQARKSLAELYELATKTPFTIPDIEKNAMMLTAMGFQVNELTSAMAMLGDVTAALPNATLERLALNLGQVRATGALTGRELRDFATAGVGLLEELTKLDKYSGKTTGQIRDMISKKMISFEDVMEVFRVLTSEGGRFYNMSERMMTTLPGMWSNFMDQIVLLTREIGEKLTPRVKNVLKDVIKFFEGNKNTIRDVIVSGLETSFILLKEIGWLIYIIARDSKQVLETFIELKSVIKSIAIMIGVIAGSKGLAALGTGFLKFHKWLAKIHRLLRILGKGSVLKGLATVMVGSLVPAAKKFFMSFLPITLVGVAIAGIVLAIHDMYKAFSDPEGTESVFGFWRENTALGYAFMGVLEIIGNFVAGIFRFFTSGDVGQIRKALNDITGSIGRLLGLEDFDLDRVVEYWTNFFGTIWNAITSGFKRMINDWWSYLKDSSLYKGLIWAKEKLSSVGIDLGSSPTLSTAIGGAAMGSVVSKNFMPPVASSTSNKEEINYAPVYNVKVDANRTGLSPEVLKKAVVSAIDQQAKNELKTVRKINNKGS